MPHALNVKVLAVIALSKILHFDNKKLPRDVAPPICVVKKYAKDNDMILSSSEMLAISYCYEHPRQRRRVKTKGHFKENLRFYTKTLEFVRIQALSDIRMLSDVSLSNFKKRKYLDMIKHSLTGARE